MEIFTELKRILCYIGLLEFNVPNAHLIAIILQASTFITMTIGTLPTFAYLLYEDDAVIAEQIQCVATTLAYLYVFVALSIFSSEKDKFFGLIQTIDEKIHERERKYGRTIYSEMSAEIGRLSAKVMIFMGGIVIPLLIIPTMLVSYFDYYVMDKGEASFRIFTPLK